MAKPCICNHHQIKGKAQAFSPIERHGNELRKRRLDVTDYTLLQEWDALAQQHYLKIGHDQNGEMTSALLSKAQMLEALGNGCSVSFVEAVFHNMLQHTT